MSGLRRFVRYGFSCDVILTIGRDESCNLSYRSRFVSLRHASITLVGERFCVRDLGSSNGTFVNGRPIAPGGSRDLVPGDIVRVQDLVVMAGHRFICMNSPGELVLSEAEGMTLLDHEAFKALCPPASQPADEPDLFCPAPRLTHSIHARAFQIDGPPQAPRQNEPPALMQIGPQFLMGFASLFMAASAASKLMGGADVLSTLPAIVMAASMAAGMLVLPIAMRAYRRRAAEQERLRRERAYADYLNGVEAMLVNECEAQATVLRENRGSVPKLLDDIAHASPQLMNRTLVHDDFMDLRVGVGSCEMEGDVRWPQKRFAVEGDRLMDKVDALCKNPPRVNDVPLAFNPVEHYVAGLIGPREQVWAFARGIVMQACGMYGYRDVKLVLVADADERTEWDFVRGLPHLYDDVGSRRFLACDYDALSELSMALVRVLEARLERRGAAPADFGSYYLMLCANKALCERSEAIGRLSRLRENKGFSLVFFGEELRDLPRECDFVIDLGGSSEKLLANGTGLVSRPEGAGSAVMFDRNDVSGTLVRFEPDIGVSAAEAQASALALARLRLDFGALRGQIPSSLGFLQMFEVGNVAQLDIGKRWVGNDPSRSLAVPVGRDAAGELVMLNLHESAHGPHGLIAGTTGSGKSELIITWVLSMCVNYSPDEVAFVLIDYKGGGLAGAFDNARLRLPHLAGTITNLDGSAIRRSLVSIESELKRRQAMLNRAREITGEATMDIYKYLSYYRAGALAEPLPHLFIVADEFAELKAQEPEFMDELISAARIGRSLGVHLVLATQKPTGVVNDQIWSNSRFKICLKVADAADSKEMIRRPDAAEIALPGRFYLLVGFNEHFTCAQSAYTGAGYAPMDTYEPPCDNSVDLVDDTGVAIASMRPPHRVPKANKSELDAVLEAVQHAARRSGKQGRRLWLEPLPARIDLGDLERRYAAELAGEGYSLVVGELDNPARQRQELLRIDLVDAGNVIIYGAQPSGAESLLATMLFSLLERHDASELSLYVADLGTGSLSMLGELPQCGGVVLSGDDERMANLFKLVEAEAERRRPLLAARGGNLDAYNLACAPEERLPHMVVALANLSSFYELYGELEDRLSALARDAVHYGIHFIVTAATATTPRMRLRASFSSSIVTSFNDPSDYITVLGGMRGIIAPHMEKRGLVSIGKEVLEFQGASIAETPEAERRRVHELAREMGARSGARAAAVPMLPARVLPAGMGLAAAGPALVPVGYSKPSVAPAFFDLARSPVMLVLGNDLEDIARYLCGLRASLALMAGACGLSYRFIDPQRILGEVDDECVVQDDAMATSVLSDIEHGTKPCDLLVFTSIAQTMASLPVEAQAPLKDYIARERWAGRTGIVAASELWRVRSLYDEWFKVLSAYGAGVWAGSGFGDQTIFKYARSLPEYRQPARRSDGFLCAHGRVTPVRLLEDGLEANGEPTAGIFDTNTKGSF